jgi:SNF2 family DNA or RNA helicase
MTTLLYDKGVEYLNDFQLNILEECSKKRNYALSLPMGSGKTLLSIVIGLQYLRRDEQILVVVPKTLILNWINEIKKFFKDELKYVVYHNDYVKTEEFALETDAKLVITTSETLSKYYKLLNIDIVSYTIENENQFNQHVIKHYNIPRSTYKGNLLFEKKWGYLIVDEIQKFTKIDTLKCSSLIAINSRNRVCMSGTVFDEPTTERILGYHLILHDRSFPDNIPETELYIRSRNFKGVSKNTVFRKENEAFTQKPILKSIIVEHSLYSAEIKIYTLLKETMILISKEVKRYQSLGMTEETKRFSSYILVIITYLRQSLVSVLIPLASISLEVSDLSKKSELATILTNKLEDPEIKEYLNDPVKIVSSRIQKCLDLTLFHSKEKIVIFSCYRTSIDLLKCFLNGRHIFDIKSSMSSGARLKTIKEFEESTDGILLLTYNIGAEGLNLQFCHNIILLDFWWNSGKTQQAIARVFRFGQKSKQVNAYFLTSNTILENLIFQKQKDKLDVIEELNTGQITTKIKSMSTKDMIRFLDAAENVKILKEINEKTM